jgi:two-component system, NtrC family, sensor histidine kinase GlrK
MSLRLRFLLSLLAVLALMAGPALYAVSRVTMLRDIVLELRGQAAQSALAVGRLEAALVHVDRYQRVYVATMDPEVAPLMHAGTTEVAAAIGTLRAAGHGDLVEDAGIDVDLLRASTARVEALVEQRLLDSATTYLIADATPLVERARAAVPGLAASIDMRTSARVPVAQYSAVSAGTATTAAVLVGVALAIALALAAARVLTDPLDRLRRAMALVAEGTFETTFDLPYERADEVGHLSRSFRTMTERLAELDRLKAEFVGSVSHDLKTPVSVIAGYADLLHEELGGSLSPRQDELLRSLSDQTRTLQRRVDQVLEISRMESGRLRLGLEEVNIRHFAEEVHREFTPAARGREIQLELSVHDGTPPFIIADPDVLRIDVLGNLMGNALEFTPAGGTIRIDVRPDGDRVGIEVADTGPGIPEQQLGRIFERYYHSRGATGSGLGLAIAKAGTESHGGSIDVQSQVGRGTRFRVTLPLRAAGIAAADSCAHIPAMTSRRRIAHSVRDGAKRVRRPSMLSAFFARW